MTADGIRTRRNFPAETWAVVRDAYLGGETAESISRRLNISVNSIRKRASRCGWTHKAHGLALARSQDDGPGVPLDPPATLAAALRAAAIHLEQGRGAEAAATVRAAQAFADMTGARLPAPPASPPTEPTEADREAQEAEAYAHWEELKVMISEEAHKLAIDMLSDRVKTSGLLGAFALHWRAANLGPEVALADYRQECIYSSSSRHHDEDGNLIPIDVERDRQWKRDRPYVVGAWERMRHAETGERPTRFEDAE